MATELLIRAWCDQCLEASTNTEGDTLTVNVTGTPAFDVEACEHHAAPLREAVATLAAYGRGVGKGVPKVPTSAPAKGRTADYVHAPPGACPECGHASPSLGSLRVHLRQSHKKSLADVGLAPANFTCEECGSGFPNRQGLAAHFRISHPGVARHEKAS